MNPYIATAGTVLFYIIFPVIKLLQFLVQLLLYLLSPFYYVLQFLLLPVTYLGQFIVTVFGLPFRVEVRARIETVYIYVGVAVLLGVLAAIVMHAVALFTSSIFNLNTTISDVNEDRRSARSFRQKKRTPELDGLDSSDAARGFRSDGLGSKRHFLSRTALED